MSKIEQLRLDLPTSGIDILSISESWLHKDVEERLTTIPNYNIVRLDRMTKRVNGHTKADGGLCLYHKDSVQVDDTKFSHLNISNGVIEVQWVVITRPHTKRILVGNVYRPPDGNLREAFEQLGDALDRVEEADKYETLIIGDLNADASKDNLSPANNIKQFAAEHSLQQVIDRPTRFSKHNKTTIDLAFTNIKHCTGSGTLNYNISDHKPIYILKKKIRNDETTTSHWGRSYNNYTHEQLKTTISNSLTDQIFTIEDPNQCWEKIEEIITVALNKHCPIKEIKVRNKTAPFVNSELINLQNDRDHYAQKADCTCDPCDQFVADCLMKKAKAEIRKAKANYFLNQAIIHGQNPKKFWFEYYRIQPEAKPKITNIIDEETGDRIPDDKLANNINNYFVDIGENLAKKCKNILDEEKRYKPPTNPHTLSLETTDEGQIKYRIQNTPGDKPSGMTNLRTTFLKETMAIMAKEFTYLYNLVITTAIFPDKWKIATVTPIPKIGRPETCNDLRPISILPLPGKIMEQIIHDQLKKFLEDTKFFAKQQNGFRARHSTTGALSKFLDLLLACRDKGELAISIFLDFRKAFDTIDHKILLKKLKAAGLDSKACALLANYLTNRKQTTKLNGTVSESRDVKTGVPQGSTLGPLLFLIFINDLPLLAELVDIILFADDAVLTIQGKSLDKLAEIMNRVLEAINRWCLENKLTLNTKKTEYVVFGSKQAKNSAPQIKLIIGDSELREVDTYKYLGTTLDATLSAGPQISRLNQILASKLISFRKMRYCMSAKTAAYIYKATILPIIDYNDIIYNLLTKQQEEKLQRVQNRALRIVFMGETLSTAVMHEKAGVDYLKQRREQHLLALMYRRSYEEEYVDNTIRVTRQSTSRLLKVPRPKTDKLTRAPVYCGSKLWNELPTRIRDIKTMLGLKNAVKYWQTNPTLGE